MISILVQNIQKELAANSGVLPLPFTQPAVVFERAYGIKGIAAHYALPKGLTAKELQDYCLVLLRASGKSDDKKKTELKRLWRALVRLNPELKALNYEKGVWRESFHMAMGVASAFNVDDIQYYLSERGGAAEKMAEARAYQSLRRVFNAYAPEKDMADVFKWSVSPSTLRKIRTKLAAKLRYKEKKAAGPT